MAPAEWGPLRALIAPGWRQLLVMFSALYVRGRERVSARLWKSHDETRKGLNHDPQTESVGTFYFFFQFYYVANRRWWGVVRVWLCQKHCVLSKNWKMPKCAVCHCWRWRIHCEKGRSQKTKKTLLQGLNVESKSKNLAMQLGCWDFYI